MSVAAPFRLNIFFPSGDPNGVRVLSKDHWVGRAIYFPRADLGRAQQCSELNEQGVYVIGGQGVAEEDTGDDLPKIYVGQSHNRAKRIGDHEQDSNKKFWEWAIAFSSTNHDLNAAHCDWLEQALIRRAREMNQSHVVNGNQPAEAKMNVAEKAIIENFFDEILSLFPLVGVQAFEKRKVFRPKSEACIKPTPKEKSNEPLCDMLIVPAKRDGFERVFVDGIS